MIRLGARPAFLILSMALLLSLLACNSGRRETHWSFHGRTHVELTTVNGDCTVVQGRAGEIRVDITIAKPVPEGFVPSYIEMTDTLLLQESLDSSSQGRAQWRLTLPKDSTMHFRSASGSFAADGAGLIILGRNELWQHHDERGGRGLRCLDWQRLHRGPAYLAYGQERLWFGLG